MLDVGLQMKRDDGDDDVLYVLASVCVAVGYVGTVLWVDVGCYDRLEVVAAVFMDGWSAQFVWGQSIEGE